MKSIISRFGKNESGATAIEYGMIVGLVAIGVIGALVVLGPKITGYFTAINTALS